MGLVLQTTLDLQLPMFQHWYLKKKKKKKSAWWTLSLYASRRTLSWWPTAKEKASLLESRSCLGLLWVTGDEANCSRGCTARQEAACMWFGGSMACYCTVCCAHLNWITHSHQNIFNSHTILLRRDVTCWRHFLFSVGVHLKKQCLQSFKLTISTIMCFLSHQKLTFYRLWKLFWELKRCFSPITLRI